MGTVHGVSKSWTRLSDQDSSSLNAFPLALPAVQVQFIAFIFGGAGPSLLQCAGATLHCGVWASHCSGFSCCRALGLQAQQLWCMWTFLGQGWNPWPLHWQADSYPPHHLGSPTSTAEMSPAQRQLPWPQPVLDHSHHPTFLCPQSTYPSSF